MTGMPYYHSVDELPRTMPIFPLPGALLLPRGTLPLNIFEPRYVAMIEDALKTERLIGMIQPDEECEDVGAAHVFSIGCAGRITQFTETDDGRYLVTLTGVLRFRVGRELPKMDHGYRLIEPDFASFGDDLRSQGGTGVIERDILIDHLKAFFQRKQIEANWEAIEKADDESLVTALSMVCPFQPPEKQALLEAVDFVARAQTLIALLQMGGGDDEDEVVRQ
ncbi:MAG: LON peptidase substrate-binding domain-containing protein [Alphaproteobacteria bacterium]|nr:LON peptidase substrate-binding domain-containing protein [Alphaproteobacteria bacterium]